MRHALDGVALAVREIIQRIDAPRIAGARVTVAANAVQHRVAQVDVGRRHVDFRAQHHFAVRVFAVFHARKQREILSRRPVAVRTIDAGRG